MGFLTESLISSFREKRFFLKNSQKTHRLLKHVYTFLEIHAEVNICPVKTLTHILFLFQCEHMLVEELLELLVHIVDTDLFKPIVVEDLKPSNIKHTNIMDFLHSRITECFVTFIYNNPESSFVYSTCNACYGIGSARTR